MKDALSITAGRLTENVLFLVLFMALLKGNVGVVGGLWYSFDLLKHCDRKVNSDRAKQLALQHYEYMRGKTHRYLATFVQPVCSLRIG